MAPDRSHSSLRDYINQLLSGPFILVYLLQAADSLIFFGIDTLLFAMLFKFLPDAKIAWKDVWLGAVLTALFFVIGKFLIGVYLGMSSFSSVFGTAGSFAILLLWIYFQAQIFFSERNSPRYMPMSTHRRSCPESTQRAYDKQMETD